MNTISISIKDQIAAIKLSINDAERGLKTASDTEEINSYTEQIAGLKAALSTLQAIRQLNGVFALLKDIPADA